MRRFVRLDMYQRHMNRHTATGGYLHQKASSSLNVTQALLSVTLTPLQTTVGQYGLPSPPLADALGTLGNSEHILGYVEEPLPATGLSQSSEEKSSEERVEDLSRLPTGPSGANLWPLHTSNLSQNGPSVANSSYTDLPESKYAPLHSS